jgi:hypothetical protein
VCVCVCVCVCVNKTTVFVLQGSHLVQEVHLGQGVEVVGGDRWMG